MRRIECMYVYVSVCERRALDAHQRAFTSVGESAYICLCGRTCVSMCEWACVWERLCMCVSEVAGEKCYARVCVTT